MRRFNRRRLSIACLVGLTLSLGCGRSQPGSPGPTHGGPLSKQQIQKLGDSRTFRTRLGASARQILSPDRGSTSREVIVIQVNPDTASYALTPEQISAGAVIGHFQKLSGGSLRRFGLGEKDTSSYWYVYQDKSGQYMGRFVSESMDTTYRIDYEVHEKPEDGMSQIIEWKQAISQFEYLGPLNSPSNDRKGKGDAFPMLPLEEGAGGSVWITCGKQGCCTIG